MSIKTRCHCSRCTIRGLMGPAVVITIGVLFLLQQMRDGFDFGQTYPVIILVIGAIMLASSLAPMDGHIPCDPASPNAIPPVPGTPPVPPTPPTSSTPSLPEQGR